MDTALMEAIERPPVTFWGDAWRRFRKNRLAMLGLVLLAVMTLIAIVGPYLTPYDTATNNWMIANHGPSKDHWFGTDKLGRDIFTRAWVGTRISLFIGITAAALDVFIGTLYGLISGFSGGVVDDIMMRFVDIMYGIPYLLLVILLLVIVGSGLWTIILAMGISGWIGAARLIRGQVLQLKEQEFVLAARTLGAGRWRIMLQHLVPNVLGILLVNMTLTIPGAIFGEAFLSFIGLGIQPPLASLGTMISDGYQVYRLYPYQWFIPGLLLAIILFAFNVVGDGLRDALDPKLRQ
ncbi:MAG: ABC transporter permease [Clostridia bacterium]|nr:ABC transporter permease [Clostridia bacterium]